MSPAISDLQILCICFVSLLELESSVERTDFANRVLTARKQVSLDKIRASMPAERIVKTVGYDEDFYLWTESQAALLRDVRPAHVDRSNIAKELESMGKRDYREVKPAGDSNGSPSEMGIPNRQTKPELASHH